LYSFRDIFPSMALARFSNPSTCYGAQIADFITMKLTGLAMRIGNSIYPPIAGCKRPTTHARAAAAAGDVASVTAPRARTRS
jgi:hypothetical protein